MPSTAQAQRNLLFFFSCGKVSHMSYQCKTVQLRSSKVIKQPTERSGESYLTNIRDKAKIIHAKINVTKITTILSITGTVVGAKAVVDILKIRIPFDAFYTEEDMYFRENIRRYAAENVDNDQNVEMNHSQLAEQPVSCVD